jgi:hypothetical protein
MGGVFILGGIPDCHNVAQINSEPPAKLARQLTFGTNHAGEKNLG